MNITINIPDSLYNQAIKYSKKNNFDINNLINEQFLSFLEKNLLEIINERATNLKRNDYKKVLSKIPDVDPEVYDRL
jgi:hypothetical protein